MANISTIQKQGSFDSDVAGQVNANFSSVNASLAAAGILPSGLAANSIGDAQLALTTGIGLVPARWAHATFNFAVDGGGAPGLITPAANFSLPINAIIINAIIDWTTAGTGATNTTSIGISGTGGGAAVIQAATAVASLTGFTQSAIVPQTASGFKKITTAGGQLTLTTAVAALTAGVCEVFLQYVQSPT